MIDAGPREAQRLPPRDERAAASTLTSSLETLRILLFY
jgi:hypothetical protein